MKAAISYQFHINCESISGDSVTFLSLLLSDMPQNPPTTVIANLSASLKCEAIQSIVTRWMTGWPHFVRHDGMDELTESKLVEVAT